MKYLGLCLMSVSFQCAVVVLHINMLTHRLQLLPRALDVLLCLPPIVEMLSEELRKGQKENRNVIRRFTSFRGLNLGARDPDRVWIINQQ